MTGMVAAAGTQPGRVSLPVRVALLTLLLGATVVISWLGIRGLSVFNGPGRFLDETWILIWAVQALLAFGLLLGRTSSADRADPSTDRALGAVAL